jgi:phosphoglycolate phosphatase
MSEILDSKVCLEPIAILFDWDGVLADTKDVLKEAYLNTFSEMQLEPFAFDALHELPGTSLRDYFPLIFQERALEAEKIFYKHVYETHLKFLKAMEGAQNLLEYIEKIGLPMSIVSNKRGDILRKEVQHLGWDHYFYKIVGSKDCVKDKPSPLPAYYALEGKNISLPNDAIWFIGDWAADMECAHRAGVTPVLMGNPTLKNDKNFFFKPKIYVDSCLDLKKFISQRRGDR